MTRHVLWKCRYCTQPVTHTDVTIPANILSWWRGCFILLAVKSLTLVEKANRYIFALDRNISNLFQCLSSWYITYLMCLSSRELQFFYMWLYCWLWYHQAALYQWPVTDVIAGGGCRKRRVCFPRALTSGVTPVWPAVSLDQIQNREVNPPFCLLHKAPTAPPALSSDCLAVCV